MKKTLGGLFLFMLFASFVFASEERFEIQIGDSPMQGPANAPITMIEFIDFQ